MTAPGLAPPIGRAGVGPVADLGRRGRAFVIDRALAWGVAAAVGGPVWTRTDRVGLGVLAAAIAWLGAEAGLGVLLGSRATSPGRAMTRIRVVDAETGVPLGVGRALLRQLVLVLATWPTLGLGLAVLAWTTAADPSRRRRGAHDHLAGSVALDARPTPAPRPEPDPGPRHAVNLTALRLLPTPQRPHLITAAATAPGPAPESQPAPTTRPPARTAGDLADLTAPTTARPAAPSPAADSARWRITADSGESLLLEGLAVVGRRPEGRPEEPVHHLMSLRSADLSLSKTHAELRVAPDGALVVMDRGSANGSVLLRRGVTRDLTPGRPATLLDGDRVRVGDRVLTVSRDR